MALFRANLVHFDLRNYIPNIICIISVINSESSNSNMPNTKTIYTNPRDVIAQIYKILFTQSDWSEPQKKDFQRWKKRTSLDEKDNEWFQRLFREILVGLSDQFPIVTKDGVNFIAKEADLYSGQLFAFTISHPLWFKVRPFFAGWIIEYHKESVDKQELAINTLSNLLHNWKDFENRLEEESVTFERKLTDLFGKYWYLPSQANSEDEQRIILPIEKLMTRIELIIQADSTHDLIERVSEADRDYNGVKKAVYKLKKGKPISIEQLRKLRKLQMGKYYEMGEYFKDCANGFYITALLVSSVVSEAITELSKYDPSLKDTLCKLSIE